MPTSFIDGCAFTCAFQSCRVGSATKDSQCASTSAAQATRRATNVTLPVDLLAEARALGLDLSKACEQGLKAEIAESRVAQWVEENRDALDLPVTMSSAMAYDCPNFVIFNGPLRRLLDVV